MKKGFILIVLITCAGFASQAQTMEKTEVKHTTTIGQKAHNTVSRHKHYKGVKMKHKHANGTKHVTKVNNKTGEVKMEAKKD